MLTVAIHQPEYLPCLSLLDKVKRSDVLVLLDDVQFKRDSLQQRAKIAGPRGLEWLTIPFVHRFPQLVREVEVADPTWPERHAEKIKTAYRNAPGFARAWPTIEDFMERCRERATKRLYLTSAGSMGMLAGAFGLTTPTVSSSTLGAAGAKGDRVLDICRRLDATHYLSGRTGASYLDRAAFAAAGVEIVVQDFTFPWYRPDLPEGADRGLSALDALMHLGASTAELLA
ncbi:MAG: WbqC family protein [Myxococcota bacterium]